MVEAVLGDRANLSGCLAVGLHLGIHRLTIGHGGISEELLTARRDTFWSAFASDVIAALYIGRNIAIDPLEVDTIPSPVVAADEYEAPSKMRLLRPTRSPSRMLTALTCSVPRIRV